MEQIKSDTPAMLWGGGNTYIYGNFKANRRLTQQAPTSALQRSSRHIHSLARDWDSPRREVGWKQWVKKKPCKIKITQLDDETCFLCSVLLSLELEKREREREQQLSIKKCDWILASRVFLENASFKSDAAQTWRERNGARKKKKPCNPRPPSKEQRKKK